MFLSSKLLRTFLKENVRFSIPIVLGQIGQMLFGVSDVLVAGRYSTTVLAALGIANGVFAPFFMLGLGIMNSIAPLTAIMHEEKKDPKAKALAALAPSLWVATITALALWLPFFFLTFHLEWFDLAPELQTPCRDYLQIIAFTLFPGFIFQALKEYLQAHSQTFFSNGAILIFNVTNFGLNIVLMFGLGPFPEMGIKGAAYATFITRFGLALVTLLFILKSHILEQSKNVREILATFFSFHWRSIAPFFSLGIPMGMGVLAEVLVFCTVTILIGRMGAIPAASHSIVLTLASLTFMVPLALSSTAAVKVANGFAKNDRELIIGHTISCTFLSFLFMCFSASVYFSIPGVLLRFATVDSEVILFASKLLIIVGLFQIPDGIQVTLWGALRGIKVTKAPMAICLVGHWLIGLPTGYFLAYYLGYGALGLWAGLAIGLYLMALGLSYLFYFRVRIPS